MIELVPPEQEFSQVLGSERTSFMERETINKDWSLYVTRLVDQDVIQVLDLYKNLDTGFDLTPSIHINVPFTLNQEPPDHNPLLISSNEEKTIGRILPRRNTSFRVWSKLNTEKTWFGTYTEKVFEKIRIISRQHLGFDLSAVPEHIGNVYLFACNPILRKWGSRLIYKEKELLLSFHERDGRSLKGCKLVIEEDRSKNNGFTLTNEITSSREKIELPYFPDAIHTRIYDPSGSLIEHSFGTWTNFQFHMSIQENVVNLKVNDDNGTEVLSIPKYSQVASSTVGNYDLSTAHYLHNALHERKFEELESNKEFIFFPNLESSKDRAKNTLRELLNKARNRCMILDPYFQASDLMYAFTVRNISIPIQIISSASFLKDEIKKGEIPKSRFLRFYHCVLHIFKKSEKGKTYAQALFEGIEAYRQQYSQ